MPITHPDTGQPVTERHPDYPHIQQENDRRYKAQLAEVRDLAKSPEIVATALLGDEQVHGEIRQCLERATGVYLTNDDVVEGLRAALRPKLIPDRLPKHGDVTKTVRAVLKPKLAPKPKSWGEVLKPKPAPKP